MLILPYTAAKDCVNKYPKQLNIISVERQFIVDPTLCLNHLLIPIDDIDDEKEFIIRKLDISGRFKDLVLPQKEHIRMAIEFSNKYEIHIVHCMAGLSRSPGIAYAILRNKGLSKSEALNKIDELTNGNAVPNQRIVNLTEEIMDELNVKKSLNL